MSRSSLRSPALFTERDVVYNNFNASDADPLNPELFDDPDFVEVYRSFYVELRVLGTEADPEHPGYPRINFGGSIDGHAIMVGHLNLTSDDQIRWHFVSELHGNAYVDGLTQIMHRHLVNMGARSGGTYIPSQFARFNSSVIVQLGGRSGREREIKVWRAWCVDDCPA